MTAPYPHPEHVRRLAAECAHLSHRTSQIAAELAALQTLPVPMSAPAPVPAPVPIAPPPAVRPSPPTSPTPPRRPWLSRAAEDGRLVGTVLAVAGVAVTVVGVGLMLVLAAQAGLLRPEIRVAVGALFAVCLAAIAVRSRSRGAGVGAVAAAATAVATAYLDVLAVTRLYHWVPTAVGLLLAGVVGTAGIAWARGWRSEMLALVTVIPLIAVAPLVAGGVDLGLVGFMLVMAVACVAVSHRTPWAYLPVVAVSASSLWVLLAVVAGRFASVHPDGALLALGCAATAVLGLVAGLSSVARRIDGIPQAIVSVVGAVPALGCGLAVDRVGAALVVGGLAAVAAALVVWATRRDDVSPTVRAVWAGLAVGATLIAVPTAVDGPVAVPALLAIAAVVTLLSRGDRLVEIAGSALTVAGTLAYLAVSVPVETLVTPAVRTDAQTASAVVASLVLIGAAVAVGVVHRARPGAVVTAGVVALYGLTATAVTTGVAVGGTGAGFLAGHMAATILWVLAAAAVLAVAARMPAGRSRRAPIAAALSLSAAAVAKLVTFDLATLDGAFRVGAFVAAGIVLLAVGAHQARTRATTG